VSDIVLSDDPASLDVTRIHAWLASSYWSPGVSREMVESAMAGSHCVGAFRDGAQVGFARAITDHTTFAWFDDVFVDESARGRGIGRMMIGWFLDHPRFETVRRFSLVTRDAHGVYAGLGFHPLIRPERYMERLSPEVARMLRGQS
jgi:GNAT superfamily N-acetyltransferase